MSFIRQSSKKLFCFLYFLPLLLIATCGNIDESAISESEKINTGTGNSSPSISSIADQTINEDFSTGTISFTISDSDTPASSLIVTAASSDTTVVPIANIVFGGSGENRTVTVTPDADQNGSVIITISVSDGSVTTTRSFTVTVNSINDAPTISSIATQYTNQTTIISFTIADVDSPIATIVLDATSDNPILFPSSNISLGGTGATRSITITPATGQTGSALITITASDGLLTGTQSFNLITSACTSAQSGSILLDATFSGNAVCGEADNDVIIENGHIVTWDGIGGPLTGNIEIRTGGILQITGAGGTISGNIDLAGGTLDLDNNLNVTGDITQTGNSTIDVGTGFILTYNPSIANGINLAGNTLTFSGAGNINNGTNTININGSSSILQMNGTGTIQGNVGLAGGTLSVNANSSILGTISQTDNSTIDIADTFTLTYNNTTAIQLGTKTLTVTGKGTFNNSTSIIDLNNASSKLTVGDTTTIQGNIQIAGGTLDINESVTYAGLITHSATSTIDIAAGKTFTYTGTTLSTAVDTLRFAGTGTFAGDIDLSGNTLDISDSCRITGDINFIANSAIDVTVGKIFSYSGAALSIGARDLTLSGAGDVSNDNNFILDNASSELTFNGAGGSISNVSITAAA
ncbi:hypothetical protein KKA14_17380, partial [bacterium]|nr:hypothetical protein [bacterium]